MKYIKLFLIVFSITVSSALLAPNVDGRARSFFSSLRTTSTRPQTPPVAMATVSQAVQRAAPTMVPARRLAAYRQFAEAVEPGLVGFNHGSQRTLATLLLLSAIRNRIADIASRNAPQNQARLRSAPVFLPASEEPVFNNNLLQMRLQELSGKKALPTRTAEQQNDTLRNIKKRYVFGPHMMHIKDCYQPIWKVYNP
jgi:hypothetical protein